jgi:hypothetical protein
MVSRIREPPIVGVPALEKWLAGPSSLMDWPICLTCNFLMNHGAKANPSSIAVNIAAITLKGT